MFVLVDYQRISTDRSTLTIVGLYNTDDGALYYYKPAELVALIKKSKKEKKPIKIKGLEHMNIDERYDTKRLGTAIIEAIDGIGFIDFVRTGQTCYRSVENVTYKSGKQFLYGSFSAALETVFTKPMKIARYTSSMTFWYKGVKYRWQDKHKAQGTDKLQTTAGLSVIGTIPWKPLKHYFYSNRTVVGVEENISNFIKNTWPPYMTNTLFIESINEVQKYICPVTSFYRCNLPYCENLDLKGLDMQYITKLRNCFWKSNSLKNVSFANLDLSNILDIYWPLQDDSKLEYVDFRYCKGDIQLDITNKLLCNLTRMGDSTCILLNKKQVNFARLLKETSFAHELTNVTNIHDVQKAKEFVTASAKLMTGKMPKLFFVML